MPQQPVCSFSHFHSGDTILPSSTWWWGWLLSLFPWGSDQVRNAVTPLHSFLVTSGRIRKCHGRCSYLYLLSLIWRSQTLRSPWGWNADFHLTSNNPKHWKWWGCKWLKWGFREMADGRWHKLGVKYNNKYSFTTIAPGLKACLCYPPAMWPMDKLLPFLKLQFLICNMSTWYQLLHTFAIRTKEDNVHLKEFIIVSAGI